MAGFRLLTERCLADLQVVSQGADPPPSIGENFPVPLRNPILIDVQHLIQQDTYPPIKVGSDNLLHYYAVGTSQQTSRSAYKARGIEAGSTSDEKLRLKGFRTSALPILSRRFAHNLLGQTGLLRKGSLGDRHADSQPAIHLGLHSQSRLSWGHRATVPHAAPIVKRCMLGTIAGQ
jgi:hypothetical protein